MNDQHKSYNIILFMSRGMTLQAWDKSGLFDREMALYRELQRYGHHISILTYGGSAELGFAKRIPGIKILYNRFNLPQARYEKLLPFLHAGAFLKTDLIKTNQMSNADVALRAAKIWKKRLIARGGFPYSFNVKKMSGENSNSYINALNIESKAYQGASCAVATTEAMKNHIVEQHGIPAARVQVIPNYVLEDEFKPTSQTPPQKGRICFIGRLYWEKNLTALLDAVNGLDVELVLIGAGEQETELRQKTAAENLPVTFLGSVPHFKLPEMINSAEIFILPSFFEGHPKALLEAMSCGAAVIGTDTVGIREIITHRHNGYLCGLSSGEIRSAIQEVLADDESRKRMGYNARQYILEHCSLASVARLELELYDHLMSSAGSQE